MPIHSTEQIEEIRKDLNPPINLSLPLQDKDSLVKLIDVYNDKIGNFPFS